MSTDHHGALRQRHTGSSRVAAAGKESSVTSNIDTNDKQHTTTTATTTDSDMKKSSVSSESYQVLYMTHLYSIIWCLHYIIPFLDTALLHYFNNNHYNNSFDAVQPPPQSTLSSSTSISSAGRRSLFQFHPALDHRSLTLLYDYYLLLPLVLYILYLYARYTTFFFATTSSKSNHNNQNKVVTTSNITTKMSIHILQIVCLAHGIDTIVIRGIVRMPFVWDHEQWAMIQNGLFMTCYIIPLFVVAHSTTASTTSSRQQQVLLDVTTEYWMQYSTLLLGLLYGASVFWKFTTSFWYTPTTSCGSVLVLETLVTYLVSLGDDSQPFPLLQWAQFAVTNGPLLTVLVETTISIGMIYLSITSRSDISTTMTRTIIRNALVITTILFHLVIYMLPVNAAGGFSLDCITRLVYLFHPRDVYTAVFRTESTLYTKISRYRVWMICLIVWIRYKGTGHMIDVGFLFYCLLIDLYIMIMLSTSIPTTTTTTKSSYDQISWITKILSNGMIMIGIVYGVGLTILGLQHMGAPTMYSNLRMFYGGNHLLVPTGLLGDDVLYGGRLVQVVYSTSDTVNQLLGYIDSAYIVPEPLYTYQKLLLRNSSIPNTPIQNQNLPIQFFPLCLSNPHSKQLLMESYRKSNPIGQPVPFQFILPLNVIRRAIQTELRSDGNNIEPFVIKLADGGKSSELKQPPPLEEGVTEVIVLNEQGLCTVELYTRHAGKNESSLLRDVNSRNSCNEHVLGPLMLLPSRNDEDNNKRPTTSTWMEFFVSKLLLPYPQIVGEVEEVCMS